MAIGSPPLTDVLSELIASQGQKKRLLSGGLILAYTPGCLNQTEPGVYRLTLSRCGVWLSEQEIEIVRRELRQALKAKGRAAAEIFVEPWLKEKPVKRPSGRIHYHVLFWRELRQGRLL